MSDAVLALEVGILTSSMGATSIIECFLETVPSRMMNCPPPTGITIKFNTNEITRTILSGPAKDISRLWLKPDCLPFTEVSVETRPHETTKSQLTTENMTFKNPHLFNSNWR
jgi:hypothetical protein